MPKTPSDLPPLPVAKLSELEVDEMGLRSALGRCTDRYGSLINEPKAYAYLRSYAVQIFDFYLKSHSKMSKIPPEWNQYFKEDSIHRVISCFLKVCSANGHYERSYRQELEATIESHIQSLLPPTLTLPKPSAYQAPALMMAAPKVSEQLKKLRDECRMTIEEIAEEINVRPRSVSRHLSGEDVPRRKTLRAYESIFSKRTGRTIQIKTS